MKVLVVTNMYPTAAQPYFGIFVARQVEAVRRAGVDVVLEAIAGERGESDYLLARRRIARLVRSERPDVIHCHYGYTPLAAAFLGRPYVVTLCGDDINGALKSAAEKSMRGVLEYCDEPLVSSDFRGNAASSIVDGLSTVVLEGKMAKVLSWYDNEWGYSCRVGDLARLMATKGL